MQFDYKKEEVDSVKMMGLRTQILKVMSLVLLPGELLAVLESSGSVETNLLGALRTQLCRHVSGNIVIMANTSQLGEEKLKVCFSI